MEKPNDSPIESSKGNVGRMLSLELLQPPELGIRIDAINEVDGLAKSIADDGVLEPLIVRPSQAKANYYEVVCGMRRFLAAKKAGLMDVPCIIREMDDREAMEAMLAENMERENLSDYEVGRWFKLLMEKFPEEYPNQTAVANRFGLSQEMVSRLISHYEALENIKPSLSPDIMPHGINLPEGIMREIRHVQPELQPKIIQTVVKNGLSAREAAELVKILAVPKFELKEVPTPPKEEKTEMVAETIEKRAKPEETLNKALVKYYPTDFVDEMIKRFGDTQPSFEKILKHTIIVLDVAWSKIVELDLVDEVFREAEAWQKP